MRLARPISPDRGDELQHRCVRAIMPQELKTTTSATILTEEPALAVAKRLMRNLTQR
jgi:hypothetical protein